MKITLTLMLLMVLNTAHAKSIESWCPSSEFRIETALGTRKLYDRSCALVISASDYKNYGSSWDNIPAIYADRFSEVLQTAGFAVRRVERANSELLKSELTDFLSNRTPRNTRLLIYFSGHGDADENLVGYIVPEDAPTIHENKSAFITKSVSSEQIQKLSRTSSAKHVLFIFDSCHSGALYKTRSPSLNVSNFNKKQTISELFFEDLNRKSRQFITATDEVSTAPIVSEFSTKLIEGFSGKAVDPQLHFVSGFSLYMWLRSRVESRVPQFGDIDSEGGDVVVAQPEYSFVTVDRTVYGQDAIAAAAPPLHSYGNTNRIFENSKVIYYQKLNDYRHVFNALDKASIPYTSTRANKNPDKYQTNTIACHPSGAIEPVKAIAKALIDSGVEVMEIQSFRNPNSKSLERIELLNTAAYDEASTKTPLTLDQIESLSKCPKVLKNPRY